jgi:hypothetical protein
LRPGHLGARAAPAHLPAGAGPPGQAAQAGGRHRGAAAGPAADGAAHCRAAVPHPPRPDMQGMQIKRSGSECKLSTLRAGC